jgi:hypothetical protein
VIKWRLQGKKATLDFLEHLHKIYSGELKDETASYRDISNYFIKPPKDTAPPAPSHDNCSDTSVDHDIIESSSSSSEEFTDDELVRHP